MGRTSATRPAEAVPRAQSIVNTDFPEFPVPVLVFPIIPYTGGAGTMHGQHFSARLCVSAILLRRHSLDFWDQVQARLVTIKRKNGTNRRRIASVSHADEWGRKYAYTPVSEMNTTVG